MSCGLQASMGIGSSGAGSGGNSMNGPQEGAGPDNGSDVWMGNHGHLPMKKQGEDIKATAQPTMATGDRRGEGPETYIEVRGPASLGARSSVPYMKALPQYRKRAEEAIARKKIPKSRQRQVKAYFDSLQRGKK